jgi:Subtilisin inhibitor-like
MTLDKPTALRRPRSLAAAARCMIAVAGLAAVAACGSVAATGSGSSSGSAPAPKGSLNITIQGAPGTAPRHYTLRCDPAGGTHPHAAATCAALLAIKNPFGKPKPHQMCPMIMASSKRMIISGDWYGQKIHKTIQDGGCNLALFTKLNQVMR